MKPTKSNTFCHYPFKSLALKNWQKDKLGTPWVCCKMGDNNVDLGITPENLTPDQIFNHPRLEKLRYNALNNIQDEACVTCWKQEQKNNISKRLLSEGTGTTNLTTLDLTISNQCNLRCRMCNPGNSNQLMIDYKFFKDNDLFLDIQGATNFDFVASAPVDVRNSLQFKWLLQNTHKITTLEVSGGEPFYDKNLIHLLDKYIENNDAKNTTLHFHTNGTLFTEDLCNKLLQFKNNQHTISVDGVGKVYEYIRYPQSFSMLENSIKNYINIVNPSVLWFNLVLTAHNLFNLEEYKAWVDTFDVPTKHIVLSEVHSSTRGVSLKNLPVDILKQSKQKYSKTNIENLTTMIDDAIHNNIGNTKKLYQETILFDQSRNQRYEKYLDKNIVNVLKILDKH